VKTKFVFIDRQEWLGIKVGICAALVALLFFYLGILHNVENLTVDLRFKMRGEEGIHPDVMVVGITHRCINELGKLPWPRSHYTTLIDRLKSSGAKVIVFDTFFPVPSSDKSEDIQLARAIREAGNVLLPEFSPIPLTLDKSKSYFLKTEQLIGNIPILDEAAVGTGHINVIADHGGVYRKMPIAIKFRDRVRLALGLMGGLMHKDVPPKVLDLKDGNVVFEGLSIPLYKNKSMYINYAGIKTAVPSRDIIRGQFPQDLFKGKVVIVGQTAQGLPNADILMTPFGESYGVVVQANVMNTILSEKFLRPMGALALVLSIVFVSIFLGAALIKLSPVKGFVFALLFVIGIFGASLALFVYKQLVVEIMPLYLSTTLNYALTTILRMRYKDRLIMAKDVELDTLLEAGQSAVHLNVGKTQEVILSITAHAVNADGAILRSKDEESDDLMVKAKWGIGEEILNSPISGIDERIAKEAIDINKLLLIEDTKHNKRFKDVKDPRASSIICAPLAMHNKMIGVLTLYRRPDDRKGGKRARFDNEDLRLISILSNQGAMALENFRLYNDVKDLFMNSIRSIAETIDAKDPYTRGHSERVTQISMAISEKLDMTPKDKEKLRISAILHDVGKIGVSDFILAKPAKLDDKEQAEVRKHPELGAHMMSHIKQLKDMIPGINSHHERYDGKGFPGGLKGEEIPFFGRIIAVADSFDAMTSDRPYRKAMGDADGLIEITRCAGTQFDPKITVAFEAAFRDGDFRRDSKAAGRVENS